MSITSARLSRAAFMFFALVASMTASAHHYVDEGFVLVGDSISSSELTSGDFNGDGRPDVMFCNGDTEIIVIVQAPGGVLERWQRLPIWSPNASGSSVASNCLRLEVRDLNLDGRSDVVIMHRAGITTLVATPTGFTRYEKEVEFRSNNDRISTSTLLDVDADGDLDLLGARAMGGISLWRSRGLGLWDEEIALTHAQGVGDFNMRAADLDSDGKVDFALSSDRNPPPVTSKFEFFKNLGNGTFAPSQLIALPEGFGVTHFEVGDFNDDGRQDLVVNYYGAQMILFPQQPSGGIGPYQSIPVYRFAFAIAIDDMDNDGRTDIVTNHAGWIAVSSHRNTPAGFAEVSFNQPIFNIQSERQGLATGDFNGDGCKDIIVAVNGGYHLLRGVNCVRAAPLNPTGAWYDPAQDGHGLQVQMISANHLLAFWYTFDTNGKRAYFIGDGAFDGNTAYLTNFRPLGSYFPPNFVAGYVRLYDFGTMRIDFQSCSHGTVAFDLPFGQGSMNLTRLTQPVGVECEGSPTTPLVGPLAGATGAWHDPDQDKQGLVMESLSDGRLLATWYSMEPSPTGGQTWLTGVGSITGDTATLEMFTLQGGRFIPNFNPAQIIRNRQGTITVTMNTCGSGRVDWSLGSYGTGTMPLQRLTIPYQVVCAEH